MENHYLSCIFVSHALLIPWLLLNVNFSKPEKKYQTLLVFVEGNLSKLWFDFTCGAINTPLGFLPKQVML